MTAAAAPVELDPAPPPARPATALRARVERAVVATAGLVAVVAPVVQVLDLDLPGRLPLALLLVLLAPGAPAAVLLRVADGLVTVALGLALSLSALLVVSTLLLVGGVFDPRVVVLVLALLTLLLTPAAWVVAGRWHRAPAAPRDPPLPRLPSLVSLAGALALWWVEVDRLRPEEIGATGLVGVVGPSYAGALLLTAVVAAVQLRGPRPDPVVMTAAVLTLVVLLFGLLNVADSAPSFRTAYVHAGFIDHISDTGEAARGFDARFSWPGFFAAGAVLVDLAGLPDAMPLIALAPVVYNALAVPALLVIGTALSGSRRTAWCGVLVYTCMNWFSQDYLSPQATAVLLYLAILSALLVTAVPQAQPGEGLLRRVLLQGRRVPPRPPWLTTGRAVAVEVALVAVGVAMVLTHQLTPVTLIGVLLAFTLTGTTRYRLLWLLTAITFLSWFSYGAEDFWRGHLDQVFGDVGQLGSTLGSSVGERLEGDPTYAAMQQLRLLSSAGWLALAALGLWLRRRDPRVGIAGVLAFGPFALLAVQSYGGEVLLRCFVYAQPALAPLVAVVVLRGLDRLRRPAARVLVLTALVTAGGLLLTATRGANAGFERISGSQVDVARTMLAAVPDDSRVGLPADAGPLGFDRLVEVDTVTLSPERCEQAGVPADDVAACALEEEVDYLYVTSTMDVLGQLRYGRAPGWTGEVVQRLVARRAYVRVASGPDVLVLARVEDEDAERDEQ